MLDIFIVFINFWRLNNNMRCFEIKFLGAFYYENGVKQ